MQAEPIENSECLVQRRVAYRTLSLPAYDVRVRRELAQRRLFAAIGRHIRRIVALHVFDAVTIMLAVVAAERLSFRSARPLIFPLVALTLLGLNARSTYRPAHGRRDSWRVVSGVAVAVAALAVTAATSVHAALSFFFLAWFAPIVAIGLVVERRLVDLAVRQAYAHGVGLRKAIIAGRPADVRTVVAALTEDHGGDHCIIGHVTPTRVHDADALGSIDDIESILDRADPAELILAGTLEAESLRRVAQACVKRGIALLAVPTWGGAIRGWAEPVRVGRLAGYHVHPARLALPSLMLKRATDLTITSVGLLVAAPVMAVVAVAIKVDSPGPVFYRQRRVGLGGREFVMWKFRSMKREADGCLHEIAHLNSYKDGRLFKLEADPRITRVGRVLRRFSLDELPQLFNVLSGDMSLVGPRPPVPAEVGKYEPRHFIRLSVVPGMTGPWQVNGRNLITDFEQVVQLEKGYVDTWSLGADARIMLQTVGVVLSGKGAY